MRALLDVNVLIALLDPEHATYSEAHRWFTANLASGWASCPLTENGCLRIMTSRSYPGPWTPEDVLAALETAKGDRHHEFWPDDLSITDAAVFDRSRLRGHQQITDIYLLGLALAHGGRLVTFDQGIRREAVIGSVAEILVKPPS